jgi:ribulose-phosphate 3-epimerase
MELRIAPSLLSADFGRLAAEVEAVTAGGADWLHLDVMDGRFVPNITIGPLVVEAVKRRAAIPLDVHLMIVEPERYLEEFAAAGADWITVHAEASPHLQRCLSRIRELGKKAGVSLNPSTPIEAIEWVLPDADLVLLMTVNPGFGGQSYIPSMTAKVAALRERIDRAGLSVEISVDGGVKTDNAAVPVGAGANVVVSGSGVFRTADYGATISEMRRNMERAAAARAGR